MISLYIFNGGSHASDTSTCLNGSLRLIMYNVTHKYLPNKRSSLLLLHSRIPLIECTSEYSESLIREYIFVFATLYSRYESYSSLGVFVPALLLTVAKVAPYNDHGDRLLSWLSVQLGKILVDDYTTALNVC